MLVLPSLERQICLQSTVVLGAPMSQNTAWGSSPYNPRLRYRYSGTCEKYQYWHFGRWYIKWSVYKRFLYSNQFVKKIKWLVAKLRCLWWVYFVLPIQFVSTLASDKAILYGNIVLSIAIASTKNWYSSFL